MSSGTVINLSASAGGAGGGAGSCQKVVDAVAGVDQVIPGGSFSPAIAAEPVNVVPILAGAPVVGLAWSYAANGATWDITIYPTENFLNLKINVQC